MGPIGPMRPRRTVGGRAAAGGRWAEAPEHASDTHTHHYGSKTKLVDGFLDFDDWFHGGLYKDSFLIRLISNVSRSGGLAPAKPLQQVHPGCAHVLHTRCTLIAQEGYVGRLAVQGRIIKFIL